jgi:predicted RNase H-like nuclease (RuvC/YqgF family)
MIILLLNQGLKNFTTINMEHKITLSYSEQQEVELFCKLNNITIDELIKKSFKTGYNIEKYGLVGKMGGEQEKRVEIEVIREKRVEIPVEVIKEVEKIVEVIKEVPVDRVVIKEVPVETVVTKIEYISDKTSENELLLKIQQLESEKKIFSTKIEELESELVVFSTKMTEMENIFHDNNNSQQLQNTIQSLMKNLRDKNIEIDELNKKLTEQQKNNEMNERAKYLRSSNLDDTLYK